MGLMPIKNIDELFDFQLDGNYNNYTFGLITTPSDNVLTIAFKIPNGGDIKSFLAHKISVNNDTITILDTISLISDRIITGITENVAGVSYLVETLTAHYYKVGDIITQSEFTGGDVGYNGVKTVLTVPSTTSYTVGGTYTNSAIGNVIKSVITITQIDDYYTVRAVEGLESNLPAGLYYYYIADSHQEKKSGKLFCIDEDIIEFDTYFYDDEDDLLDDDEDDLLVTI